MTKCRLRARVVGAVQGVGYRYDVLRFARDLGVTGFVRNAPDGSVEIVAEGPRSKLEVLLEHVGRGPISSVVAGVDVEWSDPTNRFTRFDVAF